MDRNSTFYALCNNFIYSLFCRLYVFTVCVKLFIWSKLNGKQCNTHSEHFRLFSSAERLEIVNKIWPEKFAMNNLPTTKQLPTSRDSQHNRLFNTLMRLIFFNRQIWIQKEVNNLPLPVLDPSPLPHFPCLPLHRCWRILESHSYPFSRHPGPAWSEGSAALVHSLCKKIHY